MRRKQNSSWFLRDLIDWVIRRLKLLGADALANDKSSTLTMEDPSTVVYAKLQVVSRVTPASKRLPEASPKDAIRALTKRKMEAWSQDYAKVVVSEYHPFVGAVDAAFCGHRPLVLSPDMFWLLITQGLARHVNANPEKMRRRFVQHDAKEELTVRRDQFVKGDSKNPWTDVFEEFSEQIKSRIGERNHKRIVANFSTTGETEQAANEIVLMDSLKSYYHYSVNTLCGIPEVRLEGTAEDWRKLLKLTENLGKKYGLLWWTSRIIPTLKRIARNASGHDDPELWRNIYKIGQASGGPVINGWIIDFFPYLQTDGYFLKGSDEAVDPILVSGLNFGDYRIDKVDTKNWTFQDEDHFGMSANNLPGSLCKTPFIWHYYQKEYKMEFVAGFIGFSQNAVDCAVRPTIGWAVCEASER